MSRDNVVSVRLTDDQLARLQRLGGPKAIRDLLTPQPILPFGESVGTRTSLVYVTPEYRAAIGMSEAASAVWSDGTVGFQYPALATA